MIAILSLSFNHAMNWIYKEYEVKQVNRATGQVTLVNNEELKIVTALEDAIGYEFTSYRKAPDFDFIEDFIKSRIKK